MSLNRKQRGGTLSS